MKIEDYGFHQNNVLAAEWVDEDGKVYANEWQAVELGDELAYQGFCERSQLNDFGSPVCVMTGFPGYAPRDSVHPRTLWNTLAADQREAVVKGLIEQLKSETK